MAALEVSDFTELAKRKPMLNSWSVFMKRAKCFWISGNTVWKSLLYLPDLYGGSRVEPPIHAG